MNRIHFMHALMAMLCFVVLSSCENNQVNSISLERTTYTMTLGQTDSLIADMRVTGDISKIPQTWSSSNPAVATVLKGKITALYPGVTTITVEAGKKTASCQINVSDQINPLISHGDLVYYGDAYNTRTDSISHNESNNFVLYLSSPTVNESNFFSGTDDRIMLEINTDTLSVLSVPSGTYDMMTELSAAKLLPFSIVPAYVMGGYPWGSWYFGQTINDIVNGNVVIVNNKGTYDITYTLIDYYGNTISGSYHGTLTYSNRSQSSGASSAKLKSALNHNIQNRFLKRN